MRRTSFASFAFFVAAFAATGADAQKPADATIALSLRDAVDLAVAHEGSTRVALAAELLSQALDQSAQSRAALLPQLDSSVSRIDTVRNLEALGVRLTSPTAGFELPRIVGPFNVFDARVTASQSVFDFSAIRRYQAARIAASAARQEQLASSDVVTAEVARAYLTAVRARDQVETAAADVELAEALAQLAENRKTAGVGTGIEVTRAQVQLANERQNLLLRRQERRAAQLQLLRRIGLELAVDLRLTTRLEETAYEPIAVEQALDDALENRADWQAAGRRLASLQRADSAVRWERLPSVIAFADYGTIGSSINNSQPTRTYGASVSVPLFDGGRRKARRGESDSRLRSEELRLRDLQAQIELEVRLASDSLESAAAQMQVAEQGALLAANELEQAQRRYKAGVGSSIEVTDAQTRLARARQNRLNALYAFNLARVDWGEARGRVETVIP